MRLEHSFTVPVPVDEAWGVLLDVPRIAPCLPGAALTDFDGEAFNGTVKVKLGPIALTYKGKGRFVERDEAARRVVIEASGRDVRAAGTAAATVTAVLAPDGDATRVEVATELTVTGRPAQFGRGMLSDVSGKLLGQFATCLAGKLGEQPAPPAAQPAPPAAAPAPSPGPSPTPPASAPPPSASSSPAPPASASPSPGRSSSPSPAAQADAEVEPIDLLQVTGISGTARRYAPYGLAAIVVGAVLWLVVRWLRDS